MIPNTNKMKTKIFAYLIDCSTNDFEATDQEVVQDIHDRFVSEYCYAQNMQRYPSHQVRAAEWLAGLAIGIDYTYTDIIKRVNSWLDTPLTEKQEEELCEKWFHLMAFKLLQLFRAYGIDSDYI